MNSVINKTGVTEPEKSCCFSGHRIVRHEDREIIIRNLPVLLEELYANGINTFISGGALGFDTIAADEVIRLRRRHPDVRLILALPCKEQAARWTDTQKTQYDNMLSSADDVLYISERYLPGCMQKRNRFMVDNCMTIIVYIQSASSGTGYTTKYALDNERNIINILTEIKNK